MHNIVYIYMGTLGVLTPIHVHSCVPQWWGKCKYTQYSYNVGGKMGKKAIVRLACIIEWSSSHSLHTHSNMKMNEYTFISQRRWLIWNIHLIKIQWFWFWFCKFKSLTKFNRKYRYIKWFDDVNKRNETTFYPWLLRKST